MSTSLRTAESEWEEKEKGNLKEKEEVAEEEEAEIGETDPTELIGEESEEKEKNNKPRSQPKQLQLDKIYPNNLAFYIYYIK